MTIKTEPKLLRRSAATIIDYGLYFVFYIWVIWAFGVSDGEGTYTLSDESDAGWWILTFYWVAYFPVVESLKGQTLGKMILSLRVVTKNGNPISFWQALKRHVLDMFDFFFFGIVAYVAIKNTPDHQRLGDLLAKTIVIGEGDIKCSKCKEPVILTVEEMQMKEFICPACNTPNKM